MRNSAYYAHTLSRRRKSGLGEATGNGHTTESRYSFLLIRNSLVNPESNLACILTESSGKVSENRRRNLCMHCLAPARYLRIT